MKLINAFAILAVSLANFTPISASPAGDQTGTRLSSGLASIAAQVYPGGIAALEQLKPGAGQQMEAAAKQACDVVKDIDTGSAQLTDDNAGGSSIFSPITSFVSSILPSVVPAMTAAFAVARGDTSQAPTLVALAQQACVLAFNGAEAA